MDGKVSRISSAPNSALRYCSDKAQYFGLKFFLRPLLFPDIYQSADFVERKTLRSRQFEFIWK